MAYILPNESVIETGQAQRSLESRQHVLNLCCVARISVLYIFSNI